MDPITQTILKKSMSSAVSFGVNSLLNKIPNSIFEKEEIGKQIFVDSYFDPLIERDFEYINKEINKLDENLKINFESICKFFTYPEIECVIRQTYAASISNNKPIEENIKEIKKEFTLLLSRYFGVNEERVLNLSSLLFSVLIEGCQDTLDKRIANGEISAVTATSNYHFKLILDELCGIRKNIQFLTGEEINPREIQSSFEIYRFQLKEEYKWIPIANLEGNVRKPVDKIYVCPSFIKRDNGKDKSKPIEFFEFLSKIHRVVLLGDPGNGKTTFTKKICYELSSRYTDRLFAGREIVPFLVFINDYHVEKMKNRISIIDFINNELKNYFQGKKIPNGFFEYLLLNGYILMIFDGLDELLNAGFREKMVKEIELFCTLYPSVPVIVTSRRVGYEEAALREDMFEIYEMTSFDESQIQEYVQKWFSLDTDLKTNEQIQKADSFMLESEKVSDLRSNSLMLSLMCNIYKQENYIPENRPKIYQACSEILFRKWDRRRNINPEIMIQDSKIESLISYLAYWIYTSETSSEGVIEEELIDKATEFLYGSTYEDFDQARMVAKEFINFSKGRAWILTEFGVRKDKFLYQFTHRTFLEYFTAEWLCKEHDDTIELTNVLIPKISKREWDVVAQLAFQKRGDYSVNATDKIINVILEKAKGSNEVECENLLSFLARSLEFMAPNPTLIKKITERVFEFSLFIGKNRFENMKLLKKPLDLNKRNPIDLILNLKSASRENKSKVTETLKKKIIDCVNGENKCEAILAAEIIFELPRERINETKDKKEKLFWSQTSEDILKECYQYNKNVFEEDLHLCIQSNEILSNNNIETLLAHHGLEGILSKYLNIMGFRYYRNGIGSSLLEIIFILALKVNERGIDYEVINKRMEGIQITLKRIGEFCLENTLPIDVKDKYFTRIGLPIWVFFDYIYHEYLLKQIVEHIDRFLYTDPMATFGEFCLFACFIEIEDCITSKEQENLNIDIFLKPITNLLGIMGLIPFSKILSSRFENTYITEVEDELSRLSFTERQKEFVKDWAQKRISFLNFLNGEILNIL